MNPIAAQQVSLDNTLVAPENRIQIGQCNMRIDPTKTPKEPTYQVVLDSIALSPLYPAFLITAEICPRLPNQEFDAPLSDEEIITFIKQLGHKGDIKSVTDVVVDKMHQPWRTFASIINKGLSRKITNFMFQIDNRDHKKQEKIYYPRFTKAIIHYFISKDKSISMRNRIFMHTVQHDSVLGTLRFVSKSDEYQVYGALLPEWMTNQQLRDSPAYKTYLVFTTGVVTPKKARKFKKSSFPSKKNALVDVEEPAEKPFKKPIEKPKKAPAKAEKSKGIELLSNATLLKEAQLKKAIKRSKQETHIHQVGGSSKGDDFELEVPDEPKGKSINTSKGTGLKPGVPDVSKQILLRVNMTADINKTDDEEDNEFVHTPEDYVPTDDEDVDDEKFEHINKEMYSDVNVELKDSEHEGERKDDEVIKDAEHEEVSQEVAGDQVKDDAQETVTAAFAA
ncbi:hypothetical protein Tco_1188212 [Tanacetum coccineum]